ncbi:MAG: amine oxidase [Acidobacteria bacterium]|nr:MAG: amine oxidase [Acidobacteriota bacterium]
MKSVIVIGGGLAGLAAGVALAESGWRVRLFEQRPFLGGRATSYVLPDGQHVDNCQHVTLGCCTNLEDFYGRIGAAGKITFFDRLLFLDPQGRRGEMQAGRLPAPFHLTWSFAAFAPLTLPDKLSIARAMLDILRTKGKPSDLQENGGISMLEWLRRRRQTKGAIERFWRVVLERRGVEVVLRTPVRGLKIENGEFAGLRFDEGREETADAYVFAVPHTALGELLPQSIKQSDAALANLDKINVAPITGVHLWFDRQVMTDPFLTLLDTTTQWIFNKSALYADSNGKEKGSPEGQYLQLVISASYDLLQKPRQEIIDLCLGELREALPAVRDAELVKATVIKEAAATFSPEPGVHRWRPRQQTSVPRLFLAGDWTDTGWPATMEGAVRSGYLAAEALLRSAGTPRRLLQPDLEPDGFIAMWLGRQSAATGS